jgi:hypothetical protein
MLDPPAIQYRASPGIDLPERRWPAMLLSQPPVGCSVDLRDGYPALIETMDPARKLRMFETLVRIGCKQIEIGLPSASQADFDVVRLLIEQRLIPDDVTLQVLTPVRDALIRRTFEALGGVPRATVHLCNATAPVRRRVVLGLDEGSIVELASSHARWVQALAAAQPGTAWTFQYSPEMFSGTELAFAKCVIDAVTAVWQPALCQPCIINLPSTVADILAPFEAEYRRGADLLQIDQQHISEDSAGRVALQAQVRIGAPASARLLQVPDEGAGPVEAAVEGLPRATGVRLEVLDCHEHAIDSAAQARAAACLALRIGDTLTLSGVGIDANTVSASMTAVLAGLLRCNLPPRDTACAAPHAPHAEVDAAAVAA